jgi:cobalt-zinc-cadmium efflux system membrane fusion protein
MPSRVRAPLPCSTELEPAGSDWQSDSVPRGQDLVFVKTAQDRFAVRPVRTGETADGKTPILEGIQAGEAVAVRGTFILKSQLLKSTLENE